MMDDINIRLNSLLRKLDETVSRIAAEIDDAVQNSPANKEYNQDASDPTDPRRS